MKTMRFIFYFLLLAFANAAMAEKEFISNLKNVPGHPRILLLKGEEKALLKKIGKDRIWKDVHTKILQESDAIVQLPVSEYKKEGRRLLSVSRENLRRIFFLSYAYRMSGKPKYMERAEKEMLQIASFSDWNPSHFLDVAEMTMAMAIGYDWLYADMPTASRKIIKEAILQKGLAVSLDEKSKTNWWIKASNNWNQVCHAGMAYGALALAEDAPDMAKQILNRAIDKIRIPMEHYGPDGAYPEGIGYWEYGTSFNVMFLSAIEKVFRSDFGLSEVLGFLKTGEYAQQMVTPLYNNFCYADNGSRAGVNSTIFWFYDKTKEASLLYQQAQLLENQACKSYLRNRLLPSMLVWGAGVALENTPMPRNLFWMAGGDNPVCAMRSGWEDPDAIYVGVKAGSPNVNHGHMDVGSFILEADGVRWAVDLGMENYNQLEQKHVNLWNMSQESQRWDVFRYNNKSHNTLTFNDKLQHVSGMCVWQASSDNPDRMFVTTDLTPVYASQVKRVGRTVALVDRSYVVVEDKIKTGGNFTKLRWSLVTMARPFTISADRILLEKDGKKLYIKIDSPVPVRIKSWPAQSENAFDSPNPGALIVGFEADLEVNTEHNFNIYLMPKEQRSVK